MYPVCISTCSFKDNLQLQNHGLKISLLIYKLCSDIKRSLATLIKNALVRVCALRVLDIAHKKS